MAVGSSQQASLLGMGRKMKKTFLTSIAALFLATGAAHATDKLPDTITGKWCFFENKENQLVYSRVLTPGNGGCEMAIDQEAIHEEYSECVFERIKQIRANAFEVFTRCIDLPESESTEGSGPAIYEIIDGKLVITHLSEG
jgi:hypothetical protein